MPPDGHNVTNFLSGVGKVKPTLVERRTPEPRQDPTPTFGRCPRLEILLYHIGVLQTEASQEVDHRDAKAIVHPYRGLLGALSDLAESRRLLGTPIEPRLTCSLSNLGRRSRQYFANGILLVSG